MFTPYTTTGIGSLPHKDPDAACRLVLESVDIPFWPQLPHLSFREFMIPQYAEGLPFLHIDEGKERIWVVRDDGDQLLHFYETYTEDWQSPLSEHVAKGLHVFLRMIEGKQFRFLKGQVTGPLTFTLGLKDADGRYIFFDEELREISLLLLKAKIRWQIEVLKQSADTVIIFIDEPILSALGTSGYLGVAPSEALRLLQETVSAVESAGAVPAIHCCGKADWPMIIQSNAKIINFDAYEYSETISLYPQEFTDFLKAGGYLAWGIIPTTEAIVNEHVKSIKNRFDKQMEMLARSIPSELLHSQILLTPACGAGSRSTDEAVKVLKMLTELKSSLNTVS